MRVALFSVLVVLTIAVSTIVLLTVFPTPPGTRTEREADIRVIYMNEATCYLDMYTNRFVTCSRP